MRTSRFALLPVGVAMLLVASGCSGSSTTEGPSVLSTVGPTSSAAPDETGGVYPVTAVTERGEMTIDAAPERIVALGDVAYENVVAVGERPIGSLVTATAKDLPYFADHVDAPGFDLPLGDVAGSVINFEAIAELDPDLIVVPAWPWLFDETNVGLLEAIAPTLVVDVAQDWRVGAQQVADALGRHDEGAAQITAVNDAFAGIGEAHPSLKERPYSFGMFHDGQIMLGSSGGIVFHSIGMTPADDQARAEEGEPVAYSAETLGDVDGEIVLLMPTSDEAQAVLEASPLWASGLSDRVTLLSRAHGDALNNAGLLGKTWLAQDFNTLLGSLD